MGVIPVSFIEERLDFIKYIKCVIHVQYEELMNIEEVGKRSI